MKISIVIPSNNEAKYVEQLLDFIKHNSTPENIEEIIIVESFNTKRIVKLAEKSHAKLYYNLCANRNSQMEMGAFQAKGDIIYFIKPASTPPAGFDERIISFAQEKYAIGCFDDEVQDGDNLFIRFYKYLKCVLFTNLKHANSFFVTSKLYYQSGGLKKHGSYRKLKNEISTDNHTYL